MHATTTRQPSRCHSSASLYELTIQRWGSFQYGLMRRMVRMRALFVILSPETRIAQRELPHDLRVALLQLFEPDDHVEDHEEEQAEERDDRRVLVVHDARDGRERREEPGEERDR